MELYFKNGDYLPDGKGGFLRVRGREELLQRVLWKLRVRRGSFPFLPELGSNLHTLLREKAGQRNVLARQYVAQALQDEKDLTVRDVETVHNERGLEVIVSLDWQGEELDVTLEVGE